VVSCNNERSLVAGLWPALATIDVHLRQIGQLAVRQLIRRITGEFDGSAVTIDVKPTLLPEASIAPPRPDHDGDAKPGARRRRAAGRT
jgi:DNA-binding LacI/PurR family transcriptional regulator